MSTDLEVALVGPLLDSKVQIPRRRGSSVARPRLRERLDSSADATLTLISAPPGFGKTTLLVDWLAIPAPEGRTAAWLSLDRRDDDPTVFWSYFITALRTAAPDVGAAALAILQSSHPPMEAILSGLLNDMSALTHDVAVVLDDYHVIENDAVHEGMAFLLQHLPHRVHLVIVARADPPFPLAHMRARGELAEIRAADLRFTAAEAAAYFDQTMGMALTAGDLAALEGRTEGWIAALQLAALSIRGREDVSQFIHDFAGDDRHVVDYLAEEVLDRQPPDLQRFLLRTSILDRLSGPLCDAVTGQDGGAARLVELERANLFLVPLDDRRRWYRYHQLFADVLRSRLLDEHPDDAGDLHRRASMWFESAAEPAKAIDHALAARDFDRAAGLAERAIPALSRARQESVMLGWIAALPDDVVRVRPVLTVGFAGVLVLAGRVGDVESRLRDAERMIADGAFADDGAGSPPRTMIAGDDDHRFRGLPGMIELYRAALALARGDVPGTVQHARRARDLAAEQDHLCRAAAFGVSGLAYWAGGDLEAGHAAYADCMAGLYRAGHVADTFGCAIALADIRRTQGRLGDALRSYEQALERADQNGSLLRGTADMYVGMSEISRERGDLQGASEQLVRSRELGENGGLPQNPYRWRVSMARILHDQGNVAGAVGLLDEAQRLYVGDFFPNVRPIAALRARMWLAQGAVDPAVEWARNSALCADDDLSYLREFEHITLVRILLARYGADRQESSLDEAAHFLGRLLEAAETGGRAGSVIEILVLQALTDQLRGDIPSALSFLHRALALAEPEGYVQVFVMEAGAMTFLLRAAGQQPRIAGYVRRLVNATRNDAPETNTRNQPGLVARLSDRELDVLRLLCSDLDGPAIARRLVVSLNTVRTHTKSIYAKLGVSNRRSAVRRAQELNLR